VRRKYNIGENVFKEASVYLGKQLRDHIDLSTRF